jgi:hypothetical protein
MSKSTEELLREDLAGRARAIVEDFRAALAGGASWYSALLDAIARWPLPQEWIGQRYYRYLIAGEAFDWLLLAERLLDDAADLVPEDDRVALLFRGERPGEQTAEAFRDGIGASKYQAHLNYVYGVIVEEALQLSVEEDLHKESRCCAWGQDRRIDENVYQRIYGKPREELLEAFRAERGLVAAPEIALSQLREFSYWLFKYRMRQCDPAKVASDTRRGLVQLSHMQARRLALTPEAAAEEPAFCFDGRVTAHV